MAAQTWPTPGPLDGRTGIPPHGERDLDSIAWKINSEIVLLLGWNPAILLQIAHPLVAAGVTEHSLFLADPDGRPRRLWRTLNVMFDLTFGLPDQVQRAADAINAVHDRVHGRLREAAGPFAAGHGYSAHDPELLRWVHCTMLEVFPRTYRLYVGPLSDAEWDRYCAEASRVEPLLGLPDGYLPSSLRELRAYMWEMIGSGQLAVSAEASALAHEIVHPRMPLVLRPLLPFFQLPMVGLLPPSIRTAYGFPWDRRRARLLRDSARPVRPILGLTPSLFRHWPAARRAVERARRGELEPPAPRSGLTSRRGLPRAPSAARGAALPRDPCPPGIPVAPDPCGPLSPTQHGVASHGAPRLPAGPPHHGALALRAFPWRRIPTAPPFEPPRVKGRGRGR